MKNRKVFLVSLILVLMVGVMGCSSGGSSSGGSTPPPAAQTPTQKLVGTWTFVNSSDYVLAQLIFNSNGSGSWGTGFSNGRIDNGVFYFTLDNGNNEAFDITWNSDNNITLTNHNGGSWYTYSRAS
jgi:hypothetical protein